MDIKTYKKLAVGDTCKECGYEVVEITRESLEEIKNRKLVIKSIPELIIKTKIDKYIICPKCDAYALGIEMTKGIAFKDKNGEIKTINDIENNLYT